MRPPGYSRAPVLESLAEDENRGRLEARSKPPVFKNRLSALRVARNASRYHFRIWNREWSVCPKIPNGWGWCGTTNNKTLAVLSMLYYLIGKTGDSAESRRAEFEELLEEFQDIDLRKIGAPERWLATAPWSQSE